MYLHLDAKAVAAFDMSHQQSDLELQQLKCAQGLRDLVTYDTHKRPNVTLQGHDKGRGITP